MVTVGHVIGERETSTAAGLGPFQIPASPSKFAPVGAPERSSSVEYWPISASCLDTELEQLFGSWDGRILQAQSSGRHLLSTGSVTRKRM